MESWQLTQNDRISQRNGIGSAQVLKESTNIKEENLENKF